MDDLTTINKKRKQKNLPELTIVDYAQINNLDLQNPLSFYEYKPGQIDWEKVLK